MYIVGSLLYVALMTVALVDIITRDAWQVNHLPKFTWALIVIMLPLIGSILWFTVGREWPSSARRTMSSDPRAWSPTPEYRAPGETRSTEQQLRDLEREIAEAERRRADRLGAEGQGSSPDPA